MRFILETTALLVGLQLNLGDGFTAPSCTPQPTRSRPAWRKASFFSCNRETSTALLETASSSLEEMDREALLEYLNSDAMGLSFQEYLKQEQHKHYLENCIVFNNVASADLDRIAASMKEVQVPKGTKLIEKGDTNGDSMYFVVKGKFECFGDNSTVLTTYEKKGEYFGELALIFKNQPRQATIVASQDSVVYQLDNNAFQESLQDSPVFDTARQMLLKKYKSKRLRDVVAKIQINEVISLLRAKLQADSSNWVNSLFSFTMGASWTILATLWSGGATLNKNHKWPVFFDLSSSASPLALPVPLVSTFLTITAILGYLSIPKSSTATRKQQAKRTLFQLGVGIMMLLCARGTLFTSGRDAPTMIALLPLQMMISMLLETTRGSTGFGDEAPPQKRKKRTILPALAACTLLGYETLRLLLVGSTA